jgi:hypothetical protein
MDPLSVIEEMRADARNMAGRIVQILDQYGIWLAVSPGMLSSMIRQYAEARRWSSAYNVRILPTDRSTKPTGWTTHDEDVWQSRLSDCITDVVWATEIIDPVFGTDVRVWERNGSDWRYELLAYVPLWASRSFAIVEKYDPLPRAEEEAAIEAAIAMEEADSGEFGGRRRRR